jgi:hypothetical protein
MASACPLAARIMKKRLPEDDQNALTKALVLANKAGNARVP